MSWIDELTNEDRLSRDRNPKIDDLVHLAMLERLREDKFVHMFAGEQGVMADFDNVQAPYGTKYLVSVDPMFDRDGPDTWEIHGPDEGPERATIVEEGVFLLRCFVNKQDLPVPTLGHGRFVGIRGWVRIVKQALARLRDMPGGQKWVLGLDHVQFLRFENTFYVNRARHSEGQVTVVVSEVLYADTMEPAPAHS